MFSSDYNIIYNFINIYIFSSYNLTLITAVVYVFYISTSLANYNVKEKLVDYLLLVNKSRIIGFRNKFRNEIRLVPRDTI